MRSQQALKSPEDFYRRNIKILKDSGLAFENGITITTIQRVCRIGYNQACDTRSWALENGQFNLVRNAAGVDQAQISYLDD